jgi:alanine racemase
LTGRREIDIVGSGDGNGPVEAAELSVVGEVAVEFAAVSVGSSRQFETTFWFGRARVPQTGLRAYRAWQLHNMSRAILTDSDQPTERISPPKPQRPQRPAWVEIDLGRLQQNFQIIHREKPPGVQVLSVVKDDAYGHGALQVARAALEGGAAFLALSSLDEALALRQKGIRSRMLLLGERQEAELAWCVDKHLTVCVNDRRTVELLGDLAARAGRRTPVHLKINTGMNRYGVRWTEALELAELVCATKSLSLEGALSHFAMSDELDKSFALLQLERFNEVLAGLERGKARLRFRHLCNSGGFLDLPQAHFDMVRIGMLQYGVYPSKVCRRLEGMEPVMSVKARIAGIQNLAAGDVVGYGMRYRAESPRRIAVIPVGYGDGFPRVRNQGFVLVHGQRAPLVGGVAMDALTVDITEIPEAKLWDEVVLMGRQGGEEISVHEVALLKNTVSYDVLPGWRARLPRIYVNGDQVV